MLTSITPLGERGRQTRWSVTVTAFIAGSTAAGAGLGAVAGGLGSLLPGRPSAAFGALLALSLAALAGAAADLGIAGLRLPSVARQVNEDWLHVYRGWVYGVGFGAQLGAGLLTVASASAVYLTFLAALLAASPALGALVGGLFGLARGASLLATARVDTSQRLLALARRLDGWRRPGVRAAAAAQAGLALLAVAAA